MSTITTKRINCKAKYVIEVSLSSLHTFHFVGTNRHVLCVCSTSCLRYFPNLSQSYRYRYLYPLQSHHYPSFASAQQSREAATSPDAVPRVAGPRSRDRILSPHPSPSTVPQPSCACARNGASFRPRLEVTATRRDHYIKLYYRSVDFAEIGSQSKPMDL